MTNPATRGWGDPTTGDYSKKITSIVVDNTQFNVHKDVALIFSTFLARLCTENNYSLDEAPDDWSWVVRPIRGYENRWELTHNFDYLSLHSWGIAVDVNSDRNPMGAKLVSDLPVYWIHNNAKPYKIAWGGDYAGRKDAMHFEFMGTPKDARAISDRIRMGNVVAKLDDEDRKFIDDTIKKYVRALFGDTPDKDATHVSLADINGKLDKILAKS